MSVVEPIYIATASEAGIRAAALAASNNGGGIVKIPVGTITLSAMLPMYDGVIYEGVPVRNDISGAQTSGIGGTILQGDGTFIGMGYNTADLGAPLSTSALFMAGMLSGTGARDITFVNFSYGLKIGGLYNPGIKYSTFHNLSFVNCQQWGAWIENYAECNFTYLTANNCQVGGIVRVGSGATLLDCGNSKWEGTNVTIASSILSRGICTWTRGSSNMTQETSFHEGAARAPQSTVTQAATMSNASANITVTDGTKFPLDMPMTWSASINGFVANQIYFVVSQSSNVIQVANTMRGTAITPTSNNAVNALTKGFAPFEIAALDSGSGFIGPKVFAVDIEGTSTAHAIFQNISKGYTFIPSIIGGDVYQNIVRRTATRGYVEMFNTGTIDSDISSGGNIDLTYDGSNTILSLLAGNKTGIILNNSGKFQYGTPYSGRWGFGDGAGNAFSSALDTIVLSKQGNGYVTLGSAASGNVALNFSQGGANGGAGNGQGSVQLGLVGTATDADYKFNTTNTGRANGDFLCQTYTGSAIAPAWYIPGGSNNVVFGGAALINNNGGVGYSTGAGGTVTQGTSKSTGVTLNKASGAITMNAAALAAATIVSFVLTDSAIAATDVLILNHISGGTPGSYSLNARCAAGSATIDVRNNSSGSLSEAIVIQFALVKAVTA